MPDTSGLMAIKAEMARQRADALASFETARAGAAMIAASVQRTGRLLLLGMGGSHWVNRTAAALYRSCGIDVAAEVLSELLITPLPIAPRTALITSQSGASGEVVRYLDSESGAEERFGLTLDPSSSLGRRTLCLVGVGGPERAFAATRSLLITHALHLAVLSAIGVDPGAALAALRDHVEPDTSGAVDALRLCTSFVLSGRGPLQGVAESGALCLMELARCPALAFDGGQLRHGPMEMLSPQTGIIFLRGTGQAATLNGTLATACRDAGAPVVIFDSSGLAPIEDVVTVPFAVKEGMAAVLDLLPALQTTLVAVAAARVPDVGSPVRSSKITTVL